MMILRNLIFPVVEPVYNLLILCDKLKDDLEIFYFDESEEGKYRHVIFFENYSINKVNLAKKIDQHFLEPCRFFNIQQYGKV